MLGAWRRNGLFYTLFLTLCFLWGCTKKVAPPEGTEASSPVAPGSQDSGSEESNGGDSGPVAPGSEDSEGEDSGGGGSGPAVSESPGEEESGSEESGSEESGSEESGGGQADPGSEDSEEENSDGGDSGPVAPRIPAPSRLSFVTSGQSPSSSRNRVSLTIHGVERGDTLRLFTNSNCSTAIGQPMVAGGSTQDMDLVNLPIGRYTFYANRTDAARQTSACSTASLAYEVLRCPQGYGMVPGRSDVGAPNNFCAMRYEAKMWQSNGEWDGGIHNLSHISSKGFFTGNDFSDGEQERTPQNVRNGTLRNAPLPYTYKPVSHPTGVPWHNVTPTQAWQRCASLNSEFYDYTIGSLGNANYYSGGRNPFSDEIVTGPLESDSNRDGTYALISNPEWMALARNIENVAANWTDNAVGRGCLKRGNAGGAYPCQGGNSGYNGSRYPGDSGNSRADNGTAQLELSNGEVFWDLSANAWEWVDWTLDFALSIHMAPKDRPFVSSNDSGEANVRVEISQVNRWTTHAPASSIQPSNATFTSAQGLGLYQYNRELDQYGSALRGGIYGSGTRAGVFALNLAYSDTGGLPGFRCVYRPYRRPSE